MGTVQLFFYTAAFLRALVAAFGRFSLIRSGWGSRAVRSPFCRIAVPCMHMGAPDHGGIAVPGVLVSAGRAVCSRGVAAIGSMLRMMYA